MPPHNYNLMKHRILIPILIFFVVTTHAQIQQDKSKYSMPTIYPSLTRKLTLNELQRIKDEIYARHRYTFSDQQKTHYFLQYPWYSPIQRNTLIELNNIEKTNIELINEKILKILDSYNEDQQTRNLLSPAETKQLLTPEIKKYLGILFYNIRYVYRYKNVSENNYIILAENPYNDYKDNPPLYNDYLKLLFCINEGNLPLIRYDISDLIDIKSGEFDIRFLQKYFSIEDLDMDGVVEPIIVYGAMGENGYHNGWIKIIINYKNELSTIIINNSDKKNEKSISLTSKFYSLPNIIQQKTISILEKIETDSLMNYPKNWKEDFKRQETLIW